MYQIAAGARVYTDFAGDTRQDIVENLRTQLLAADWVDVSGSVGDRKLDCIATPEGNLRYRVRLRDPGGTNLCARVQVMDVNENCLSQEFFLRAEAGKLFQIHANRHQFATWQPDTSGVEYTPTELAGSLNDLIVVGLYTGSTLAYWTVTIVHAADPENVNDVDQFTWSKNGGPASDPISITPGIAQSLSDGIAIYFSFNRPIDLGFLGGSISHTVGDYWTIRVSGLQNGEGDFFMCGVPYLEDFLRPLITDAIWANGNLVSDARAPFTDSFRAHCSLRFSTMSWQDINGNAWSSGNAYIGKQQLQVLIRGFTGLFTDTPNAPVVFRDSVEDAVRLPARIAWSAAAGGHPFIRGQIWDGAVKMTYVGAGSSFFDSKEWANVTIFNTSERGQPSLHLYIAPAVGIADAVSVSETIAMVIS